MQALDVDLAGVEISRLVSKDIKRMIEAIGLPLTLQVLRRHGGTRIRKPRGKDPMMFPAVIGKDAARSLAKLYEHAEYVTLPKADKILQEVRDTAIRADRELGLNELAERWNLTTRQILNIRRGDRGDKFRYASQAMKTELQGDLFRLVR